jgi:glycosyltransferase involved in cell wall biosynthesis
LPCRRVPLPPRKLPWEVIETSDLLNVHCVGETGMRIHVLIATYNRAKLLQRAVESVMSARLPSGLHRAVVVVDNGSVDATPDVIAQLASRYGDAFTGLAEARPGKSHALNRGMDSCDGDLVGLIDDDETIGPGWFEAVARAFDNPVVSFAGGPCRPNWESPPPPWISYQRPAILGVVDGGSVERWYGEDYPGVLMGGNAVIRTAALRRVGAWDTSLGRFPTRLGGGEDLDMMLRLVRAGFRGKYLPDMEILHWVPNSRMTKRYFRRWCFDYGSSSARLDRMHPEPVSRVVGVPRYLIGGVVRTTMACMAAVIQGRSSPSSRFDTELGWWSLIGVVWGYWGPRAWD